MSQVQEILEEGQHRLDEIKETLNRFKTIDGYDYTAKERYYEPAPEQITPKNSARWWKAAVPCANSPIARFPARCWTIVSIWP